MSRSLSVDLKEGRNFVFLCIGSCEQTTPKWVGCGLTM